MEASLRVIEQRTLIEKSPVFPVAQRCVARYAPGVEGD